MLLIKKRLPVRACVGRFPDAAGYGTEVENIRLVRHTFDGHGTAAAVRPYLSPLHAAPELRIKSRSGFGLGLSLLVRRLCLSCFKLACWSAGRSKCAGGWGSWENCIRRRG